MAIVQIYIPQYTNTNSTRSCQIYGIISVANVNDTTVSWQNHSPSNIVVIQDSDGDRSKRDPWPKFPYGIPEIWWYRVCGQLYRFSILLWQQYYDDHTTTTTHHSYWIHQNSISSNLTHTHIICTHPLSICISNPHVWNNSIYTKVRSIQTETDHTHPIYGSIYQVSVVVSTIWSGGMAWFAHWIDIYRTEYTLEVMSNEPTISAVDRCQVCWYDTAMAHSGTE